MINSYEERTLSIYLSFLIHCYFIITISTCFFSLVFISDIVKTFLYTNTNDKQKENLTILGKLWTIFSLTINYSQTTTYLLTHTYFKNEKF